MTITKFCNHCMYHKATTRVWKYEQKINLESLTEIFFNIALIIQELLEASSKILQKIVAVFQPKQRTLWFLVEWSIM